MIGLYINTFVFDKGQDVNQDNVIAVDNWEDKAQNEDDLALSTCSEKDLLGVTWLSDQDSLCFHKLDDLVKEFSVVFFNSSFDKLFSFEKVGDKA